MVMMSSQEEQAKKSKTHQPISPPHRNERMYNGIGLSTVRGSATSGYVQKNLSYIKPEFFRNKTNPNARIYGQEASEPPPKPKANPEILEHNRRRMIESKVFELREKMQNLGYSEEEISQKESELRRSLEKKPEQIVSRAAMTDSHEISNKKEEENIKTRLAFGISQNFVPGESFDKEKQESKRIARQEEFQKKLEEKKTRDSSNKNIQDIVPHRAQNGDQEERLRGVGAERCRDERHRESGDERRYKQRPDDRHRDDRDDGRRRGDTNRIERRDVEKLRDRDRAHSGRDHDVLGRRREDRIERGDRHDRRRSEERHQDERRPSDEGRDDDRERRHGRQHGERSLPDDRDAERGRDRNNERHDDGGRFERRRPHDASDDRYRAAPDRNQTSSAKNERDDRDERKDREPTPPRKKSRFSSIKRSPSSHSNSSSSSSDSSSSSSSSNRSS